MMAKFKFNETVRVTAERGTFTAKVITPPVGASKIYTVMLPGGRAFEASEDSLSKVQEEMSNV
jgi:hypothetical protein